MQTALGACGYGVAYVVADDPTSAYNTLRQDLDRRNLGFDKDRVLESVELIAEDDEYSDLARLYITCGTSKEEEA